MTEQSMLGVMEKFSNQAEEVIANSELKDMYLVIDKQYDLMVNIISKRNLYEFGIDNLIRNTIISIVDEVNEYQSMYLKQSYRVYKDIEETFELIDALHFVIQLQFFIYIKHKGYSLHDLTNKDVKDDIIYETRRLFDDPLISQYIVNSNIHEALMLQLSEVLEYIPWKHWKTYTQFDYDNCSKQVSMLYDLLIQSLLVYINYQDIIKYYVIKNIENFDRQIRGY
jgi:hypothetical protein